MQVRGRGNSGDETRFASVRRQATALLTALSLFFCVGVLLSGAHAQTNLQWDAMSVPGVGGAMTDVSISPFDNNRVLVAGDLLGVGLSTDKGNSWQFTTGFKSWEICSFTWHPTNANIVWVGTMSGPYRSTDGGKTWSEMRTGMPAIGGYYYSCPIERILFDPGDSNHLFAFSGSQREWGGGGDQNAPDWNSVWESVNGGANWTRLGIVGTKAVNGIFAAAVSAGPAPYVYYCAISASDTSNGQGVFKSTDNCHTWTPVSAGLPTLRVTQLVADPTQKNTLYVGYDRHLSGSTWLPGGVAKTTNGGANWSLINNGLGQYSDSYQYSASGYQVAISRYAPNTLYASDLGYSGQGIYKTTNGGSSWTPVLGNGAPIPEHADAAGPSIYALAIDATSGAIIFGVDSSTIYRSLDGGASWTDSGSFKSGANWVGRGYQGWISNAIKFNPFSNQIVLMAFDDGKYMSSADNGATWQFRGTGLNAFGGGQDVTFAGAGGQTLYATFGQFDTPDGTGIAKSTDGGVTWTYKTKPTNATGMPVGVYALPNTPATVWVTYGGQLYRSTNSGGSWSKITCNDGALTRIYPNPSTPQTFYITGAQGVWKTTNGTSVSKISGSPAPASSLTIDPNNVSQLYVTKSNTGSGDGLYRYNGSSWTMIRSESVIQDVAINPLNSSQILYTTGDDPYKDYSGATGVYLSTDGGATWSQQNNGLPMLRTQNIRFNPYVANQVLVSTGGRGFYKATLTGAGGGSLTGSGATASGTVNLTTQGTSDWAHWGLSSASSLNRKSSGGSQIASAVLGGSASRYANNGVGYTWTDGTPTATATATTTGIYIGGVGNGFRITVPASTTSRTIKLYVGGYQSGGTLTAQLSDNSAAAYSNAGFSSGSGSYYVVYTLTYRAASANQTLTIEWKQSSGGGNVTLQAATLQ